MVHDEIQHVTLGQSVKYQGYFNMSDLIMTIDAFFRKRGFNKLVAGHNEKVTKKGRQMSLRLRPFRMVKKVKLEVQVWLNVIDMTDEIVKLDGFKVNMNKGNVDIKIDSFIITKMRGEWEARDMYVFIRTIFDKYLFRGKSKDYEGMVSKDAGDLRDELESYLHLNKFILEK